MNYPLANLKSLKADMLKEPWPLDTFEFNYKSVKYVVVVSLYMKGDVKPDTYASVKLIFLDLQDENRTLDTAANSNKLYISVKELRNFFGIEYGENIGDIVKQFNSYLGEFIPTTVIMDKPREQERLLYKYLSKGDSEDPNKLYCFAVKKNGLYQTGPNKGKRIPRTIFNSQKTFLRRRKLYNMFKNNPYISFCYSEDPTKHKTDAEIALTYENRK